MESIAHKPVKPPPAPQGSPAALAGRAAKTPLPADASFSDEADEAHIDAGTDPNTVLLRRLVVLHEEAMTVQRQQQAEILALRLELQRMHAVPEYHTAAHMRAAGHTVSSLRVRGYSVVELIQGGYDSTELRMGGFTAAACRSAGLSARVLRKGGFVASQVRDAGFSTREALDAGFVASDLLTGGFDIVQIRYCQQLMRGASVKDFGRTDAYMRDIISGPLELQTQGATPHWLVTRAWFPPQRLLRDGVCSSRVLESVDMHVRGLTVKQMVAMQQTSAARTLEIKLLLLTNAARAEVDCPQATDVLSWRSIFDFVGSDAVPPLGACAGSGFSAKECREGGYSVRQCKEAGYTVRQCKVGGYSLQECKAVYSGRFRWERTGHSYAERETGGWSTADYRHAGYNAKECRADGFTASGCRGGGYSGQDCRQAGYTPTELVAGYTDDRVSARALKRAGYTATELRSDGATAKMCLYGGYTAVECRGGGYTAKECGDAGFSVRQCLEGGFTVPECRGAFNAMQFRNSQYRMEDCRRFGFTPRDCIAGCNWSMSQVRKVGYTAAECRADGYTAGDCRDGRYGYTAHELKAAGYTLSDCKSAGWSPGELCSDGQHGHNRGPWPYQEIWHSGLWHEANGARSWSSWS